MLFGFLAEPLVERFRFDDESCLAHAIRNLDGMETKHLSSEFPGKGGAILDGLREHSEKSIGTRRRFKSMVR